MEPAMSELRRLTLCQARQLLNSREVSPQELDWELRRAISARNPQLNAYTWMSDRVAEPPVSGPRPAEPPPLWGIGVSLKANIASRFQPTDCGSLLLRGYQPPFDATVVQRLRSAGAHVLGKTNMDEFGMGSSSEHSAFGPSRNPWNLERTPGGSSGSIRQPAHCCGIVGLKPTYGRVSRYGLVAFASSLDQIGPLCKDVADTALVYTVLAGHDPREATSAKMPLGDPRAAVSKPVHGLRVGVPWSLLENQLATDSAADFQATLRDLETLGAEVVPVELPTLPYAIAAYYVVATAEASANLARFDGVRYGVRETGTDVFAMIENTRTAGFGAEVKRRILLGTYVLAEGYHQADYRQARQVCALIRHDFQRAFAACDAVAMPTAPTGAFRLGEKLDDPVQMYLADVFTVPANLAGLPAISVPTGLDDEGLPLSLQLIAPAWEEERLLTLAAAVEKARDFRSRPEAPWNQ
jgi:aspartyl-tRNA(Asn)/glutamyl-tRNA(Gln) amidotransferase subunit A